MSPTVLIVDDHAGFRGRARALLCAEGLVVVGEAEDGDHALTAIDDLHPDVVLLDLNLPGADGIDCAREISRVPGAPRIILMSSRDPADYGNRLRHAKAEGFIAKCNLCAGAVLDLLAGPVV